ncbi:MAG: ATP-dependent Clp protease ATP-binding subunit [Polyangiaceae bacterium]
MADNTLQLDKFTTETRSIVGSAQTLADELGHSEVSPLHLLARVLEYDHGVHEVFRRAGADPAEILAQTEAQMRKLPKQSGGMAYLSDRMIDLLKRAEREAQRDKADNVGLEHVLHALAQEIRGPAGEILSAQGIGPGGFRQHVGALKDAPKTAAAAGGGGSAKAAASGGGSAGADASGGFQFTRDLVAEAKAGKFDPVIGRTIEVRRLMQILERRFKNHPLLIGEPGVGKTSVIRALADRIAVGEVPSNLAGARMFELDTGALVAGAKLRGEIELRLKTLVDQLRAIQDAECVLVIEDFDSLFGQGATGAGVGDLLKPLLSRSEIRIVATTTIEGVRKINEKDASILRRFSMVTLDAPSVEQATEILRGVAERYEKHHQVRISETAITSAVTLAKRYISDRALPDTAVDLLDETAARKRVDVDGVPAEVDNMIQRAESLRVQIAALRDDEDPKSVKTRERLEKELAELDPKVTEIRSKLASRREVIVNSAKARAEHATALEQLEKARKERNFAKLGELEHVTIPDIKKRLEAAEAAATKEGIKLDANILGEGDVAATLNDWTGIPVAKMLEGEAQKLLKMEERLGKRVVGQDEPAKAISLAVRNSRVGLRDPGKPIGSFLFLGPSGVGKTELAKALAEFLFDDEGAMTRLDMSEFMDKAMAMRLVGSPSGYQDSEQGGQLTEAVRKKPYSVLLFDEVEKAHQDVFNLLLQVLDDGRLTDGRGRTADFSNTVVIMTSNIGSKRILETEPKLFETEDGRQAIEDVVKEELKAFFRPEFLNRIDDIIVFKPLSKKDLRGIVDIQLRRLDKLLADREIKVQVSDKAKDRLVDLSYEPSLGARPLKRTIVRELQNPLAETILQGGWGPGKLVQVDLDGEKFTFA